MPTVIDSLIVELGLDPKDFNKGQKEAASSFLKTRDAAVKTGKEIEQAATKVAGSINRMARELIALFGVIAGSRSMAQLIEGLTTANAELGRFAANMAESPQTVAAWGAAAARVGGSAKATTDTIQRMGKALYDLRYQGKALPDAFFQLQAATGRLISTNQSPLAFLEDLSAALKDLAARDPARAFNIAQELGIDPGTYALMKEQGAALGAYIANLEKTVSPSGRAIEAAQNLQKAWAELAQTVGGLINKLYESAVPAVTALIEKMAEWLKANQDWLASEISGKVKALVEWLEKIDWNQVSGGAQQFASAAHDLADAIGGVTTAVEVLFGLWLGSKFAQVLANMRLLGAGGAAGAGAAAGGGLLGILGRIAPWLGMLLMSGDSGSNDYLSASPAERARMRDEARRNAQRYNQRSPTHQQEREWESFRGERERAASLDAFISGTTVDGRPVSRSNPMPVTAVDQGSGRGGGFLSWLGGLFGLGGGSGGGSGSSGAGASGALTPTGGNAGTPGWWTAKRQRHAYDRLTKEAGLSDAGAKGLISRWANVEASGGPSSVNPYSGAFGIAQWLGRRKTPIAGNTDYDAQLTHAINELNSTEKTAGDALRRAQTLEEGAIGASMFERAEGYNSRTGRDNFTNRTLGGMRGMDSVLGLEGASSSPALGARGAAQMSAVTNDNRRSSTSNVETRIGSMTINTSATDGRGIADAMFASIDNRVRRGSMAAAANSGPV